MINYFLITLGNFRSLINIVIIRKHTNENTALHERNGKGPLFGRKIEDERTWKKNLYNIHKTLLPNCDVTGGNGVGSTEHVLADHYLCYIS